MDVEITSERGMRRALLTGSVPFASSEEVFRRVGRTLGHLLERMPDGETGIRGGWIAWQAPLINDHPAFEPADPADSTTHVFARRLRIKPGVDRAALEFPPLGYADAALESYVVMTRLQSEGVVPASLKLQVALPTPMAPLVQRFAPEDFEVVGAAYERALFREIDTMIARIPPARLCIQWDVAIEMIRIDQERQGIAAAPLSEFEAACARQLVRLGNKLSDGVDLGYHFCYGDPGHRHVVEPLDTAKCVALANEIARNVTRSVAYIHMPVPRGRDDDAYFEALEGLQLGPDTELYLGLVHHTDGLDGTLRRMQTAYRHVREFGLATECGWGRRKPETIDELMRIHLQACESRVPA
jgi:hypothetical protein